MCALYSRTSFAAATILIVSLLMLHINIVRVVTCPDNSTHITQFPCCNVSITTQEKKTKIEQNAINSCRQCCCQWTVNCKYYIKFSTIKRYLSCLAISCPAFSCLAILMVRHFHVRHFQRPVHMAVNARLLTDTGKAARKSPEGKLKKWLHCLHEWHSCSDVRNDAQCLGGGTTT